MKFIDDRGRVFGLINIVDALIILALLVGIYFGFVIIFKRGSVVIFDENKRLYIKMVVQNIDPDAAKYFHKGETVKKKETQNKIGVISKIKIEPAKTYAVDKNGKIILSQIPLRSDVYIELKTTGRKSDDIIATGNETIRIGEEYGIITPWFSGKGLVKSIIISDK